MKNSESSATKAVFLKAGLGGLNNQDYQKMVNELYEEFEKTKQLIIDLTRHMESVKS